LRFLDLSFTNVDDEQLAKISKLKSLEAISLDHTFISTEALQSLRKLPNLRYLSLVGISATDRELAALKMWFPNVEIERETPRRIDRVFEDKQKKN